MRKSILIELQYQTIRYIGRVDWRSRASLMMYRDAFRTRQNAGQTSGTKESIGASRQREPETAQEASSDTGTASSVTTSEPGVSPRGDELETSHTSNSKVTSGDGQIAIKPTEKLDSKVDSVSHANVMEEKVSTEILQEKSSPLHDVDEVEFPKEEPIIKVKDEVQKIENKFENGTEKIISNKKNDKIEEKENKEQMNDTFQKAEAKIEYAKEKEISDTTSGDAKETSKTSEAVAPTDETDSQADTKATVKTISSPVDGAPTNKDIAVDKKMSKDELIPIESVSQKVESSAEGDQIKESEKTDNTLGKNDESVSEQIASEKDNQLVGVTNKSEDSLPLEKDIMSKQNNLDLKIDKEPTPDKQMIDTDNKSKVVTDSDKDDKAIILSEEHKIEKTEDKVLETKVHTEATEVTSDVKAETATVERSPTNEKPQMIHESKEEIDFKSDTEKLTISPEDKSKKGETTLSEETVDEATQNQIGNQFKEVPSTTSESEKKGIENMSEIKSSSEFQSTAVVKEELSHAALPANEQTVKSKEISQKTEVELAIKDDFASTKSSEADIHEKTTHHDIDNSASSGTMLEKDSDMSTKEKLKEEQASKSADDTSGGEKSAEVAQTDNQNIASDSKTAEDKSKVDTIDSISNEIREYDNQNVDMIISKEVESKSDHELLTKGTDGINTQSDKDTLIKGTGDIKPQSEHDTFTEGTDDMKAQSDHDTLISGTGDIKTQSEPDTLSKVIDEIKTQSDQDTLTKGTEDSKKQSDEDTLIKGTDDIKTQSDQDTLTKGTDDIKTHGSKTSDDKTESIAHEQDTTSENVPLKNTDPVVSHENENIITQKETTNDTGKKSATDVQETDNSTDLQKAKDKVKTDEDGEIATQSSKDSEPSSQTETNLQQRHDSAADDRSNSEKKPPEKDTIDGHTIDEKEKPPTNDTKAIQPLTNGEIESPTEESPDAVPGSSEGDDTQMSMKMMRGEVSAKTTYQRTSTGPIAISEVDTEGKYITLENTSSGPNRRDVNLDGWKLRRTVDGKRDYTYPFRNFTLKSGKSVKVLARKAAGQAGLNDLVFRDEDNWGVGSQVTTALINDKEEEKATHVQKTLYN